MRMQVLEFDWNGSHVEVACYAEYGVFGVTKGPASVTEGRLERGAGGWTIQDLAWDWDVLGRERDEFIRALNDKLNTPTAAPSQ
jgi:hypothetical protein